ncbi:tyrosine--tRNA ligase [Clostridium thermobutyricum]|uniref:Tyrosine--tRNA ligase n=1 Tax=Clostridium thermobutyricum DSM 4928 TaxID=1121339 RepID=A0A1V4SQF1_9CLOT|nr:tyrosine--tRNA ligase [Clostridium thermobutyricum]OPX46074.1 tyrosine--tRNA ligase [Clostridium thermobutyricum DSM 4928]OPX46165.1 tyrosine--tRNA ligase [Clostridium thermobutyricum DSM 4928]
MTNVLDTLKERGYIKQFTHENETRELLGKEKITFYIGFDPTADSLHVGHFIALMFMAHMQKAGHRPIVLIGGGTVTIGDPSGKTDMRKMLTDEQIHHNVESIKSQMSRFIDFSDDKAILVNNADWLRGLNYIDFLREVGGHFTVNKMLAAECFKRRFEADRGLSFLEFNYMLMQAYDFLVLNEKFGCKMELGGDDQWSNMIAGVDLVRKKKSKSVYAMTCSLLTNSEGEKMGKTVGGALWLDPEKVSPFEFFQYWRNIDDADVEKCLKLLTFVEMDEIRALCDVEGAEINKAKQRLAFEVTKLVHGEEEAQKAAKAAEALFNGGVDLENVPTIELSEDKLGTSLIDLLVEFKVLPSKSEARRLLQQNGLSLNNEKVTDVSATLNKEHFAEGFAMIKKGKKGFTKVVIK